MAKSGRTSPKVAKKASSTLRDPSKSARAKSLAGSALSQVDAKKQTSTKVAKKASKALAKRGTPKKTRAIAASVLAQSYSRPKKPMKSTTAKSVAASALSQHVSTRRTPDGRSIRVVLKPISSGSLKWERADQAVARVLYSRKAKK